MLRPIGKTLILALTLLPALNILWIIATTGANNPSNDYLRSISMFDQILSGGYAWRGYLRDSVQNGVHSYAFLFLVRLAIIKLTHWNILAEIYIGYGLAIIKVLLLYKLLTGSIQIPQKIWLLPVLSALVFSTSQISMYAFGETALQQGFIQVGILAGLWMIIRDRQHWSSGAGMALGGLLASWSGGGGLLAWPFFLLALLLGNVKRRSYYLALLIGASVAVWPYLAYGSLSGTGGIFSLLANNNRLAYALSSIGLPFTNNTVPGGMTSIPEALRRGIYGLLLLVWSGYVYFRSTPTVAMRKYALPAALLVIWGLLNVFQTTATRRLLAPWYTTSMMPYWIGLAGLAFATYASGKGNLPDWRTLQDLPSRLFAPTVFATLFVLYLTSNLTYQDKAFYLASRSPASAACLRNYPTAPTYCEGLLFQWGLGNPGNIADLARPLEKHQLSIFGLHQRWTLQGDFVLDTVRLGETPGGQATTWVIGANHEYTAWYDYRHLDLSVPVDNTVSWTVSLPENLEQAAFYTAVRPMETADSKNGSAASAEITLLVDGEDPVSLETILVESRAPGWIPVVQPLDRYRGKTITLQLAASRTKTASDSIIIFRYPYIDITLPSLKPALKAKPYSPENTELGRQIDLTGRDYTVTTRDPGMWILADLLPFNNTPGTWRVGADASYVLNTPIDLCLRNYTHFFIQIGATQDLKPHAIQVYLRYDNGAGFTEANSVWIPLLEDEAIHTYTFDLKLLPVNTSPNTRITGLRIDPGMGGQDESLVTFENVGFIRGEATGFCTSTP